MDSRAAAAEKPTAQDPLPAKPEQPVEAEKPELGPPAPPDPETPELPEPEPEADPLTEAAAAGRIVVIGDSDFVRDDLLRGDYRQMGGPMSINGTQFFAHLIDWLSQDRDLVALQSRIPVDRKLQLVEAKLDQQEDPRDAEKRLRSKTTGLVALNVMLPCLALLVLGLSVFGWRRGQKRRFLQSTGN